MSEIRLDDGLIKAMAALADVMAGGQRPWWLIGSVAVALHGGDPGTIGDIDVVIDPHDLPGVIERTGAAVQQKGDSALFRSDSFATWNAFAVPVEFMAGFRHFRDGAWHPVRPASRQGFAIGARKVFAPDRADLVGMLLAFGRPKDLRRAATLQPAHS